MNNAPQAPLSNAELQNLKNSLEIEYANCPDDTNKRGIHFEIECINEILKGRKLLKETDELLK